MSDAIVRSAIAWPNVAAFVGAIPIVSNEMLMLGSDRIEKFGLATFERCLDPDISWI